MILKINKQIGFMIVLLSSSALIASDVIETVVQKSEKKVHEGDSVPAQEVDSAPLTKKDVEEIVNKAIRPWSFAWKTTAATVGTLASIAVCGALIYAVSSRNANP